MNKNMQRFVLAAIVGSLAVMTGCGQKDNGMMKSRSGNGKQQERSKSLMDQEKKNDDGYYNGCH